MYNGRPPGGATIIGTGAPAATGFAIGLYVLVGSTALIVGLLLLLLA